MNNFPLSLRRWISTQNFPVDGPRNGPILTRAHWWAQCSHAGRRVRVHLCSSHLPSSLSWPDAHVSFGLLSARLSAGRFDSGYDPRRARASQENASRVSPRARKHTRSRVPHPGKCPSIYGLLPAGQSTVLGHAAGAWARLAVSICVPAPAAANCLRPGGAIKPQPGRGLKTATVALVP